jgi:hypothetical protein
MALAILFEPASVAAISTPGPTIAYPSGGVATAKTSSLERPATVAENLDPPRQVLTRVETARATAWK